MNAKEQSDVVKRTPLPWAQFSIVLFLQLAEPLTAQVIYPVSSPVMFFSSASVSADTGRIGLIAR
jgi:hypothetical protein